MYFYQIALLGSPLELLTYQSDTLLEIGIQVSITLSKREMKGVVIDGVDKPDFKTESILEVFPFFLSSTQIKMAQFMAECHFDRLIIQEGSPKGLFGKSTYHLLVN